MNLKERKNTYLPSDLLKMIVFSKNKLTSEEESMWLTNTKESNRGVYRCSFPRKKTSILVYPRWQSCGDKETTTVAVEALLVFVSNSEELKNLLIDLNKYVSVPIKFIISENEEKELLDLANQNNYFFHKKEKSESDVLRNLIDTKDEEEFIKIRSAFEKFDEDDSGVIEENEFKKIASYLGEKTDSEDFKQAILALDKNNDGNISIAEFVSWWKIGRQCTKALPKIYQLKMFVKETVNNLVDLPNFFKEISKIKPENSTVKSTQKINFIGPGPIKWRSHLDISMCIGGNDRLKKAEKFLSQFTKNYTAGAKANWISLLFNNINEKICNLQDASNILNRFKGLITKWCLDNNHSDFAVFISNLLVFESTFSGTSAVLAVRLKVDIEEFVKNSIENLLFIFSSIVPEKSSHELTLSLKSNQDLLIDSLNGKTLGNFLEICEVNIMNSGFRDRIKCLVTNLKKEAFLKMVSLIQLFFVPLSMNVKYNGDVYEFVDESLKAFLDIPLTNVGKIIDFFIKNLSQNLFKSTKDISIALNFNEIYADLKLNCYSFTN